MILMNLYDTIIASAGGVDDDYFVDDNEILRSICLHICSVHLSVHPSAFRYSTHPFVIGIGACGGHRVHIYL